MPEWNLLLLLLLLLMMMMTMMISVELEGVFTHRQTDTQKVQVIAVWKKKAPQQQQQNTWFTFFGCLSLLARAQQRKLLFSVKKSQ